MCSSSLSAGQAPCNLELESRKGQRCPFNVEKNQVCGYTEAVEGLSVDIEL